MTVDSKSQQPLHIAVIVVSYNTCDLLRTCLQSIYEAGPVGFTPAPKLTVIVIDNASHDGSPQMVAADFPQATLIALDQNIGFTAANNRALTHLGFDVRQETSPRRHLATSPRRHVATLPPFPHSLLPDYTLLLNPDAQLAAGALANMVDFMERTPAAGMCGARLQYGDGAFQHGAFHFPTLMQAAIDLLPIAGIRGAQRLYDSRLNGRYPMARWRGDKPFPVDFVLGATMLARRAAIEQVGGLDEGFFMYCEEMDWCLRMAQAGWQTYAVPGARVIHHEARSSRQIRWTSFVRLWQSRLRFYGKHYSVGAQFGLRAFLHLSLRQRTRAAQRRFARGEITGQELAEELAAYRAILKEGESVNG
ncbi:MAG: glycosyltransferase family 2 protein [Caldilineaceae bacterium]|nr:glycosyltransferase family 2 protein [Caldilineaceae bacterium]